MLSLEHAPQSSVKLCDGLSRRQFLQIGSLGVAGLSLVDLLRADALAGNSNRHKSVILIYLVGGPPHQDMFDLKPNAPAEIAGPHRPIATNVPGIEICEQFPLLAARADKLAIIRSIVDAQSGHDAYQCYTGQVPGRTAPTGGWPQMGSVVSKVSGAVDRAVPPYVSLCYTCTHGPYNEPGPGFLGVSQSAFRTFSSTRDDMVLHGVTPERLGDRRTLLASMDRIRRDVDAAGMMRGMDAFEKQAFGILTSSQLADALDLSKEDPRVRERYGNGDETIHMDGNGAPRVPQSLLLARRLVEAGCRMVTVNYSKWDWHGGKNNTIFERELVDFPAFDKCVSALVDDLYDRGLDKDVTVIAWGEFGRTPVISKQVGRDHWPRVSCALMFGGGMKTGQVIGATDRLGGEAVARPVRFGEVFATLYHNLGIDARNLTLTDLHGRPQYVLAGGAEPIRELV